MAKADSLYLLKPTADVPKVGFSSYKGGEDEGQYCCSEFVMNLHRD